jgi:hypothetical protein
VPLSHVVKGFPGFANPGDEHKFDKFLTTRLPALIHEHNPLMQPTIVFCMTQRSTYETGAELPLASRRLLAGITVQNADAYAC